MKDSTEIANEYEEINLHGYKIQIFKDKVKIHNHDNIPFFDFKGISNKKIEYLMLEGFIPKAGIRVEVVTIKTPDAIPSPIEFPNETSP